MPIGGEEFEAGYVLKDVENLALTFLRKDRDHAYKYDEISTALDELDPRRLQQRDAIGRAILSGNPGLAFLGVIASIGDGLRTALDSLEKRKLVSCRVIDGEKYYRAR
jgi:hypothetical protein